MIARNYISYSIWIHQKEEEANFFLKLARFQQNLYHKNQKPFVLSKISYAFWETDAPPMKLHQNENRPDGSTNWLTE